MRNESGSMVNPQKNDNDGGEMFEDGIMQEEQKAAPRDRASDPEVMEHFEFMTKTVKKLQD